MKILTNRKIKILFCWVLLSFIVFTLFSAAMIALKFNNAIPCILISSLCMEGSVLAAGYWYFKEQNRIIENASIQIREYLSGNQNARIECEYEGELYRLFHEVNSLAAILNAHAENEGKSKKFLADTLLDISHQLKTPLAALNVYNGIMQEDTKDVLTMKEFTSLSEQELDRIEILVQNLLKIAKLDAGTVVIEKSEENVSEMLGYIESHFLYRAKQEKKKLYLSGDDTIVLSCDRTWFIEAISNIVKNAFDHTEKGDFIRLECRAFPSVIQVAIKDNGNGICPEDLPHIFKRFYRSRFSKDAQGLGLGLSLSKAIAEAHNGTIEVDSELGIGTTFTMNFLIPTKL